MQAKELKIYRGSGRNYTPVPQIIIQGKWLRKLGYFIGDKVAMTVEENRIIVEKCEDGSGQCPVMDKGISPCGFLGC